MMWTHSRFQQFGSNYLKCASLMGNPIAAYGYLRSGHKPEIGVFRRGSLHFSARKQDWLAIREVIVDDEYSVIDQLFQSDAKPRVLDLGANIGSFALRFFLRCPSASIASVEAAADTFDILRSNKRANPSLNWETFSAGIWSMDGPLTLQRSHSSLSHRVVEGKGDEFIEGMSLPTLLAKLGWNQIDLIKMDIEGAEEVVIPVAVDVLKRTRALIIEVHSDRIDGESVMRILRDSFKYIQRIGNLQSGKPVYLMTHEPVKTLV